MVRGEFHDFRTLLIIGVLLTLCLSDNVGLRFMPLASALKCLEVSLPNNAESVGEDSANIARLSVPIIVRGRKIEIKQPSKLTYKACRPDRLFMSQIENGNTELQLAPALNNSALLLTHLAGRAPPHLI